MSLAESARAKTKAKTKVDSMEAASAAILENVLRRLPEEGEDTLIFRIL